MARRGDAALSDIDKELQALRQRLPLPNKTAAVKIKDVSGNPAGNVMGAQSASRAFSSLLRGEFKPPALAAVASMTTPADDPMLRYLQKAQKEFIDSTAAIDDFQYDEDLEMKVTKKTTPAYNDPFVFIPVQEVSASDVLVVSSQAKTTPKKPSTAASAASSSTRKRQFKYASGFDADSLYALPPILQESSAGRTQRATSSLRQNTGDSLATSTGHGHRNRLSSGTSTPPPKNDNSGAGTPPPGYRYVQVKYRPPCTTEIVSDGRLRFCSECHHVVLGSGAGRCPHCGTGLGEHQSSVEGKVTSSSDGKGVPTSEEAARMIAEIEEQERRAFQEAVAEWRSKANSGDNDGGTQTITATTDQRHAAEGKPFTIKPLAPIPYFVHLMRQMQAQIEQ